MLVPGDKTRFRESLLNVFALFTTTGTLICCAIPIVLVTLGLGGVMIGLVNAAPWLIPLTRYKVWVFAGSALLLMIAGWVLYRPGRTCPADPELARKCAVMDRWNRRVYRVSVGLWVIGFIAAYLALPIARWIGY